MLNIIEKKLYKVLRNVGIKKRCITNAHTIEDLYLDDLDFILLLFYFENEFKVHLNESEIEKLNTLPDFYHFIDKKLVLN